MFVDTDESIKYRGFDIKIESDDYADSPDENGDEYLFLVYDHRSFAVNREGFSPREILYHMADGNDDYDGMWIFPVYAYIHSGVSLSISDELSPPSGWDTSLNGCILASKKEWSDRNKAYKASQALTEDWNTYLHGCVYAYDCDVESCGGFYISSDEDYEYMIGDAKDAIDVYILKKLDSHMEKVKSWIKHKVPLDKRVPFKEGL